MPLSFIAQMKENELKSMCDCKQDEGEPEVSTRGRNIPHKKKKNSRRRASRDHSRNLLRRSSIISAYKMIPKAFALWLCKKKEKNLSDFFPLFALQRASSFFSSLFVLPSLNSIHVIKNPCRAAGIAGNYFCFVFVFFANSIQ